MWYEARFSVRRDGNEMREVKMRLSGARDWASSMDPERDSLATGNSKRETMAVTCNDSRSILMSVPMAIPVTQNGIAMSAMGTDSR